MPEWMRIIVFLMIFAIILAIVFNALWFQHPTILILSPINNEALGSTITVSGKLIDAMTGDLIGQPITFNGTGAGNLPSSVMTSSVDISDAGGVTIGYCPTPTCTADPGFAGGNKVLYLHRGATIKFPPVNVPGVSGIREVIMTIQDAGNARFNMTVTDIQGGTFDVPSSGNSIDLIHLTITSPVGIGSITLKEIETGYSTVGISMMTTREPGGDPSVIHTINFEDLAASTYPSPLVTGAGTFFAMGDAPNSLGNYAVQAHFRGDLHYLPSSSVIQTFEIMDSTLGTIGEGNNFVVVGDTGTGVTTLDCSDNDPDLDGDGLCASWEDSGIPYTYPGGSDIYNLCFDYLSSSDCPDPKSKDIYIELDYMDGHRPSDSVLETLKSTFKTAPVPVSVAGGSPGIALHILIDDTPQNIIPHRDVTKVWTDPTSNENNDPDDFDDIKAQYFGTTDERTSTALDKDQRLWAKKQVYHYALFVHTIGQADGDCGPSGLSEFPGNDFIVSLGCSFGPYLADGITPDPSQHRVGTPQEQLGTFMHELGHNLGLHHGGPMTDGLNSVAQAQYTNNCKPNYESVMSYTRQFPTYFSSSWVANYSGQALTPMLDENALNETKGLKGAYVQEFVYATPGMNPSIRYDSTYNRNPVNRIDWDGDGNDTDDSNPGASTNINNFGIKNCNAATMTTNMRSFNDWVNLKYNFRPGNGGEIDGVYPALRSLPQEVTGEIVHKMEAQAQSCNLLENVTADIGDQVSMTFQIGIMLANGTQSFNDASDVTLRIAQLVNGTMGPDMNPITDQDSEGDLFNSSHATHNYTLTWDTTGLAEGTWAIKLYFDYGTAQERLYDCDGDGATAWAILKT